MRKAVRGRCGCAGVRSSLRSSWRRRNLRTPTICWRLIVAQLHEWLVGWCAACVVGWLVCSMSGWLVCSTSPSSLWCCNMLSPGPLVSSTSRCPTLHDAHTQCVLLQTRVRRQAVLRLWRIVCNESAAAVCRALSSWRCASQQQLQQQQDGSTGAITTACSLLIRMWQSCWQHWQEAP